MHVLVSSVFFGPGLPESRHDPAISTSFSITCIDEPGSPLFFSLLVVGRGLADLRLDEGTKTGMNGHELGMPFCP